VKIKTIGKLLDEKITIEGLVSIVLRTAVVNGNYMFSTRNSGHDTTKTPMGMFDEELIENDLALIDTQIYNYYELQPA
jgi:Leu/Phe-tRNA-protein transferase